MKNRSRRGLGVGFLIVNPPPGCCRRSPLRRGEVARTDRIDSSLTPFDSMTASVVRRLRPHRSSGRTEIRTAAALHEHPQSSVWFVSAVTARDLRGGYRVTLIISNLRTPNYYEVYRLRARSFNGTAASTPALPAKPLGLRGLDSHPGRDPGIPPVTRRVRSPALRLGCKESPRL